jgi:RNA polymerase sigma factor (TIGR02999 family)
LTPEAHAVALATMASRDITALLQAARAGERQALEELFERLYQDLKRLAHVELVRTRRHNDTLDTTALVHEAYVRLAEPAGFCAEDRGHFMNLAARVMRHVVVDLARRRKAEKRGAALRVSWPEGFEPPVHDDGSGPGVLALDEALSRLEHESPRLAQLVELRFFAGLQLTEISALLEVSERTLKRDWRRARAFLVAALR